MECPHCHEEIPGKSCPQCGTEVPEESKFCMACGAHFREAAQENPDQGDPYDLDNRVLCPDGTCTGIIVDGRCSECQRTFEEIEAALASTEEESEPPESGPASTP